MTKLTYGSCFSGIGALDLGFEREGYACKWRIENDTDKVSVLNKNINDEAKYYGDITKVNIQTLEAVDVIVGGPPCQDLSVCYNSSGLGLKGSQSKLVIEMSKIIDFLLPSFFVIENVPKILKVWETLCEMGFYSQYETESKICKASDFGGYSRRSRAFVVGHIRTRRTRQILDTANCPGTSFQTGGAKDVLPMCLPWKGGVSLERLSSCLLTDGLYSQADPFGG